MRIEGGFTLIELMVTMIVAVIVLTVGIPAFSAFVKNNRLVTVTNALIGAMNLARSEAIKRGIRVTLCKSGDGSGCSVIGNWEQGWIVFTDPNDNATYDNATETLLLAHESISNNVTMTGNGNVADYVSYVASGQVRLTNGGFQLGNITICDDRSGNVGNRIVISRTGRVRLDKQITCP